MFVWRGVNGTQVLSSETHLRTSGSLEHSAEQTLIAPGDKENRNIPHGLSFFFLKFVKDLTTVSHMLFIDIYIYFLIQALLAWDPNK